MTSRRRALLVGGAVLLAVVLVVATWAAALRFQSPAQRAAQAQPPAAQPILVDITRGDLTETTTMTATVSAAAPRSVTLPLPQGTAVVTAVGATDGSSVSSGQAVTWVNDRPVIALAGPFPLYRDLGPGDEGADVRALQQALAGLGYGVRADGQFGPATARAVRQLYKRVGASAPTRAAAESMPSGQPGQPGQAGQAGAAPAAGSETQPTGQATSQTQASSGVGTQAATQVYVPVTEVLMLAGLPAHVDSVPAVGTVLAPGSATLSLSDGALQLSTRLTGAMALRVSAGMSATAVLGSESIPVTVATVDAATGEAEPAPAAADSGESAGSDSAGAGSDPAAEGESDPAAPQGALAAATDKTVILTPTSGTLPEGWKDATNVLVSLDLTPPLTGVLTVPQRALAAAADGSVSLLIHQPDGSFTQVSVTQKSCVAGTCAIEEDTAAGVVEGAQVRVDR